MHKVKQNRTKSAKERKMKQLYGSYQNRILEDKQYCDEIKVGTGMTEYMYTDRIAYEVIEVRDQKHVTVRKYDVKKLSEGMTNDWELISNENNARYHMAKRGQFWYWEVTCTADILDEIEKCTDQFRKFRMMQFLVHNNIDEDKLRQKGKITKYHRAHVSFGTADYHYDYEF